MKPTIKTNLDNTYHTDGTVSYWSCLDQTWHRDLAELIGVADLMTLTPGEREKITHP
jgi:hypothetical protein|tara:strand:- start:2879 stop:3049 length:171 start_codon:yes stop_codon:yes gene_type:complete